MEERWSRTVGKQPMFVGSPRTFTNKLLQRLVSRTDLATHLYKSNAADTSTSRAFSPGTWKQAYWIPSGTAATSTPKPAVMMASKWPWRTNSGETARSWWQCSISCWLVMLWPRTGLRSLRSTELRISGHVGPRSFGRSRDRRTNTATLPLSRRKLTTACCP